MLVALSGRPKKWCFPSCLVPCSRAVFPLPLLISLARSRANGTSALAPASSVWVELCIAVAPVTCVRHGVTAHSAGSGASTVCFLLRTVSWAVPVRERERSKGCSLWSQLQQRERDRNNFNWQKGLGRFSHLSHELLLEPVVRLAQRLHPLVSKITGKEHSAQVHLWCLAVALSPQRVQSGNG